MMSFRRRAEYGELANMFKAMSLEDNENGLDTGRPISSNLRKQLNRWAKYPRIFVAGASDESVYTPRERPKRFAECPTCGLLLRPREIPSHKAREHPEQGQRQCEICKEFKNAKNMPRHMRTHGIKKQFKGVRWTCPYCYRVRGHIHRWRHLERS